MNNPTLALDANGKPIAAQNRGFKRTRAVVIPAAADAAGIKLNTAPLDETTMLVVWIPKTVADDLTVYGDAGDGGDKTLPAWVQDHGTRDVWDAVKLAQGTWRGISTGASFTAYVTEIA